MFINRPRISTNGCYIGETKYYRQGERSFQDQNYRPYHLVVYYRYLRWNKFPIFSLGFYVGERYLFRFPLHRFFADGKVLMINTPETPNVVVSQLKSENSRLGAIFCGSYEMFNDNISLVFKTRKTRKKNSKSGAKDQYIDFTYNMVRMSFNFFFHSKTMLMLLYGSNISEISN